MKRVVITVTTLLFLVSAGVLGSGCCSFFSVSDEVNVNVNTPTVLVTGFEPFDGYDVNPAQLVAETLNGETIGEAIVVGISVPVEWNESVSTVIQVIEDVKPVAVISIGLAPSSWFIRVEKIGLNIRRLPADEGKKLVVRKINPDGSLLLLTDLPSRCIAKEIRKTGVPARQSCFAGTYICNNLFYSLLWYKNENELTLQVCFIHVPPLLSMDPKRGMELNKMVEAVKTAVNAILRNCNSIDSV